MLFTLGRQNQQSDDVVDLLLACHRRVLEHLVLARRLATAPATTLPESIRGAASRVAAYFGRAFPLHRDDEEEDIFPLLLGRDDELDAAIGELLRDHDAHTSGVHQIVEICRLLERDPSQLRSHAFQLGAAVTGLESELGSHLALEERTVFPAIALLSPQQRQRILHRMRARRDVASAR